MCNCIKDTNKVLEERGLNTRLDIPIMFNRGNGNLGSSPQVLIKTKKADTTKREKPIKLFASYCPFCGEKYPDQQ